MNFKGMLFKLGPISPHHQPCLVNSGHSVDIPGSALGGPGHHRDSSSLSGPPPWEHSLADSALQLRAELLKGLLKGQDVGPLQI